MEIKELIPNQKFTTPEEESSFLRERLAQIEQTVISEEKMEVAGRHEITKEAIKVYQEHELEKIVKNPISEEETDAVVLDLEPESHDSQMAELINIIQEKGIRNTLSVIGKMNSSHIEDDFHRFLTEYLKKDYPAKGLKEKTTLWKALHATLLEVSLPLASREVRDKPLSELVSSMEQFYAGSLSVGEDKEKINSHFTLEIAVDSQSEHVVFYLSVPDSKKDLFEKHLLSIFPQAHVIENKNDYNIFNEDGSTIGSVASFARADAYPLKDYSKFDNDPLNITLSAFSKLSESGEGAALQILVSPRGDYYNKRFLGSLEKLKKGDSPSEVLNSGNSFSEEISKGLRGILYSNSKKDKFEEKLVDDIAVKQVTEKTSAPIVASNIRLLTSARTPARAESVLQDLEASFNQFEEAQGNKLKFRRLHRGKDLKKLVRDFSFRLFNESDIIPLNLKELTTLFHFPATGAESSRELKRTKAGSAPAPIGLSKSGILLGTNNYRNVETDIFYSREDRMRHFYTIGQTGTGKTTLLKNMIIQDIKNGDGVCFIDPHGTDVVEVLSLVPPERYDDVIYFDPSHTERPMGLNMLEYDSAFPEQKTFVVNELFNIFQKLYGSVPESMGPMFEQYFRNATMLVIEDPKSGNTLLDVSRVLSDKEYRDMKLSRCKNPVVVQFWTEVAGKAGGDAALANVVPYVTSKFDVFLANEIMRPIVAQAKSSFNMRTVMDEKKILLVNLAKGRLGDINANLLGLILVGKILMAALSRVDSIGKDLSDFYLYIDEFQNITTNSIATILSEARKYRLSLNIAHQFIAQLDEGTKNAVFGNVGSLCVFRVGTDDANYLDSQFDPSFTANDLTNVDNFKAFLKLLVDGKPVSPFDISTIMPEEGNPSVAEKLKTLSFEKYGSPRAEIEKDIIERFKKISSAKKPDLPKPKRF